MLRLIAPIVPYAAVAVGLSLFHSAWVAILSYHFGMALVLRLSGTKLGSDPPFRPGGYRISLISALIGASSGVVLYLLWPHLSVPHDLNAFVRDLGLTPETWPVFIAYYIGVNPVIEEFYWRSFLASDRNRIIINDMLFAGYHIMVLAGKMAGTWLIVIFIILSVVAWFWRQMDRITGSLLPSLVSHVAADITIISAIYVMTTG